MCERLLNLQEIYVSGQNICIKSMGIQLVPSPLRLCKQYARNVIT